LRRFWDSRLVGLATVALAALLVIGAACGDDNGDSDGDDTDAVAEIEMVVTQLVEADPVEEADFYLTHVTDRVLEETFETTREECEADILECFGEPGMVESIENTTVDGESATTDIHADFGSFTATLVLEDDTWKVDVLEEIPVSVEIPDGVPVVDLALSEYAFTFDETAIPDDGNFAFQASNIGGDEHEVAVVKVPEDLDIEAAVQSDEEPEGVVDIAFAGPLAPGTESGVVFESPLEPGRYAMVCFITDAEGIPHAANGMWSEFTIPGESATG